MADMVDKFFLMDMSESEEEALDQLLASSPEAASRFSEKASEIYARYGLPDLGPDSTPGKNFWWRLRLGLLAFVLILAGGYGWWCNRWAGKSPLPGNLSHSGGNERPSLLPARPGFSASTVSAPANAAQPGKPIPSQGPEVLTKNHSGLNAVEDENIQRPSSGAAGFPDYSLAVSSRVPTFPAGSIQVASSNLPAPAAVSNEMSPPQSPVPTEKGYSRLKIDLVIGQSGPVTVRILDSSGADVKNLYSGPLTAGTYAFTWDGKLDNGSIAPPGKYQIESRGGDGAQTREFWIEKKKKTVE
jgi:hypothetical protein